MKNQLKNKSGLVKKNMNITAHVAEAIKGLNKKTNWKSKTSKLTKTLTGKTLNAKPNIMTEDDIDNLFRRNSKEKECAQVPTKLSTQVGDAWGPYEYRDFVSSVKFLKIEDSTDRFLSGLPPSFQFEDTNELIYDENKIQDLTTQFKKNYLVGKVVGEGAYATVRIAIYKPKQLKVALKIYEKGKIKQIQRKKSVRREIKILQLLNHPNIVKIYDVVETNNHLNIAMEYISGLSLGTYLKAQPNGRIPQKTCKKIFKQLSKALVYMHDFNISHRDIKLQNIILDQDLCPKLIDFGFSTCIEPNQKTKIFCGTPSYMAPEVVQRKQYSGENADVWALGVLLFVALTGIFPFKGATDQELFKKISDSDYPKHQLSFSKQAADLISKMLRINCEQRIKAHEIINHMWFTDNKIDSNKKRNTESSHEARKRVYTINQNVDFQIPQKLKFRDDSNKIKLIQKSGKKMMAQTCKQNLGLELKIALKSPKIKEITSFRKRNENKENLKQSLKNQKNLNGTLLRQTMLKQSLRDNQIVKKKQKLLKTQPKVIELLRAEMKKRQQKSKSITHRN